jgi:hypothetical protein
LFFFQAIKHFCFPCPDGHRPPPEAGAIPIELAGGIPGHHERYFREVAWLSLTGFPGPLFTKLTQARSRERMDDYVQTVCHYK